MRSVLLDTNLLVLLIVGLKGKKFIATHKRTKDFLAEDHDLLVQMIDDFDLIWITSHCLAEVSNLLRQTHDHLARELMVVLSQFVDHTKESHIQKSRIFDNEIFIRFGVADTGFVEKSKKVTCSYTTDIDLYLELSRLGRTVINFNHVRVSTWNG